MRPEKPTISIIVAFADNRAIGMDNRLLWHISEDLRYFKSITGGHTIIMGRKTWESIGRPLPNRRNIVVSRSLSGNHIPGVEFYPSFEEAIEAASKPKEPALPNEAAEEIFVIGGGELYRQAIPVAKKIYATLVHTTFEDADTFFPKINLSEWKEIYRESFQRGEKFEYPFEFVVVERNG